MGPQHILHRVHIAFLDILLLLTVPGAAREMQSAGQGHQDQGKNGDGDQKLEQGETPFGMLGPAMRYPAPGHFAPMRSERSWTSRRENPLCQLTPTSTG